MGSRLIILIVELFVSVFSQVLNEGDRCSESGVCMTIESCMDLRQSNINQFQQQICSFQGTKPIICCPIQINLRGHYVGEQMREPSLSEKKCYEYMEDVCPRSVHYAVGGIPAKGKELPFMARIGYDSRFFRGRIIWQCGGSLISEYFVLSAGHCSSNNGHSAKYVRLGELDMSTNTDDADPQDFKIVERINHPKYNKRLNYNDIALFRLNKQVEFNNYIRPVCLQPINSFRGHKTAFAAGWGINETGVMSDKLMKVNLNLYEKVSCKKLVSRNRLPYGLDDRTQICSGTLEGGRDTCNGDSGGPLFLSFVNNNLGRCVLYTQIGITSFGMKGCGLKNYPAVYTKVAAYRNWIERKVWGLNTRN